MNNKPYKEIAKISPEERETIRRKTAYSLPDDPSARGMRPDQVRKRFWEAIAGDKSSIFAEIDRLAAETNTALDALWMLLYGTVEIDGESVGISDLIKTGLAQGYTLADLFEGLSSGDALRLIHEKTTGKNLQQCLDDLGKLNLTAKVAPISGGHRVTLTDKNGERYFDVMNGKGIHIGPEAPTDGQVAWIDTNEEPSAEEGGANFDITAKPGQVIAVKAVDVEGKPKEYKAVDLPVHDAPDWNAAEGAAGHVLNRTHYVDEKGVIHKLPNKYIDADWMATKKDGGAGKTVIIPEQTVTNSWENLKADLVEGDTYAVEVNGVLYKCVCRNDGDGTMYLGNGTLLGATEGNSEPFAIAWLTGTGGMFYSDGTLETPIGIKVSDWVDDAYNTLPKEYMPDISWNELTDKPFIDGAGAPFFTHTATFATDAAAKNGVLVAGASVTVMFDTVYWLEVNGELLKCHWKSEFFNTVLYDEDGNDWVSRSANGFNPDGTANMAVYVSAQTAGTYTFTLYAPTDELMLDPQRLPPNLAKKSDIPTGGSGGGSASIDVTAEVGQTIIVKEVDADGKPTKWESADYQPRTHWRETGIGTLVPNTVFHPIYDAQFKMLQYPLPEFGFEAGKSYTVIYDGVEYAGTAAAGTFSGLDVVTVGNTYLTTGVMTNEPFIVAKIPAINAMVVVCLTAEGTSEIHSIQINGEKTVYHKPAPEYAPNEYWVSFAYNGTDNAGKLVWLFSADWDELRAAIRERKNIYADCVMSGASINELIIQKYMLGFADVIYTITEHAPYQDFLMFGVCHNDRNDAIGTVVYVYRWLDGTVTVSGEKLSQQPT